MSPEERQELKALFVATALYYGHEIPDDVLPLYVADLDDLPFTAVSSAIGGLRRDPKTLRCPLPSQIRAKLNPASNSDSEAVVVVGKIVQAISRFGPFQLPEAKAFIGPIGWIVVQMEGSWENICLVTNDDLSTRKAQWRQLAKSLIDRGAGTDPSYARVADRSKDVGLTSLGEMLTRLTARPTEEPQP